MNKIETAVGELKSMTNQICSYGTSSQQTNNCKFDMFGKLISTHLKKLPEFEALAAMQEIQSCLLQRRMAYANRSSHVSEEQQWFDADVNINTSTLTSNNSSPQTNDNSEQGDNDIIRLAMSMI